MTPETNDVVFFLLCFRSFFSRGVRVKYYSNRYGLYHTKDPGVYHVQVRCLSALLIAASLKKEHGIYVC